MQCYIMIKVRKKEKGKTNPGRNMEVLSPNCNAGFIGGGCVR